MADYRLRGAPLFQPVTLLRRIDHPILNFKADLIVECALETQGSRRTLMQPLQNGVLSTAEHVQSPDVVL
jgi:hypothetical protein